MSNAIMPAALAAAPMPAWASTADEWEQDLDGSWSRFVERPVFPHVDLRAIQHWTEAGGFAYTETSISFGLEDLHSDGRVSVADEAQALGQALVEVAGVLREAGL